MFVYENGKAVEKTVTTGIQDQEYIQILSGLKGDEEVISSPYNAISKDLNNGDKVRKVPKNQLFESKQ